MGQPIVVAEKPSASHRGVVRFETNRTFSGMGHERYSSPPDDAATRPPDELARRLFALGGVLRVHVNGNIITVDLEKGHTSEGMATTIEDLYRFYRDPAA